MKIRRIIADFIDFTIIYVLLFGQYNLVIECLEKNNLYESIIYILFIILGVFILCSKEILFKGRTLGKKITKLYVVDCYNNIEYDVKRLFLRNLLTLITLPISIICIIIYNRTVGDFLLKSKVVCFNQNSILDKSKINNKFVLISFIFSLIVSYSIIFSIFFLGQKINYNSLRFVGIQIELLNLVVFIILFLKIFKKLKYIYNIILTIILTMLSAFISILIISNVSTNIEKSITKNYDIREIFKYMFQRSDIIDEYVFDNYAFIVFKEEGKDYIDYDIIYYLKNNDSWIIQENFENQTEFKYYMETTNNSAKLTEMYLNFINEYNVGVILINPNYEVQNGIIDSLGIEYKEIKLKNKYIYVAYINSKINNDYNLTINDKIYYPNH